MKQIYTLWRYGSQVMTGTAEELAVIVGCVPRTIRKKARTADPFPNGLLVTASRENRQEAVEEPVKPEEPKPVKPKPVEPKPEPVKPEPVKAEPAKAEPAKAELVKPKPAKQEEPKQKREYKPHIPVVYRLYRDGIEVDRGTADDLAEWYEEDPFTIRLAAQTGGLFLRTYQVIPVDQLYVPKAADNPVVGAAPSGYTSWRERHPGERVPVTPGGHSGRARAL